MVAGSNPVSPTKKTGSDERFCVQLQLRFRGLKLVLGPIWDQLAVRGGLEQASDGIYAHVVRATAR